MRKSKQEITWGGVTLELFIIWTVLLNYVDVKPVGSQGTMVGFSTINVWFHDLTGVHMQLYTITDWLEQVPIAICLVFGVVGLVQWIKRRRICKVDYDILVLGVYYIIVVAAYFLFEEIALNYRPILIDGRLEASYPSSTTLLTVSVMITTIWQIIRRIQNGKLRIALSATSIVFTSFIVICRLISGVHWITDIIGGILLSISLSLLYIGICNYIKEHNSRYVPSNR